jgi:hypothetical protein
MRILTPLKIQPYPGYVPWGQVAPPIPLPSPTDDLEREVPPLYRPQARASWQPLTADLGNPWFRIPQEQNLRLFEQLVETIPVLARALRCIVQLVGCVTIDADDETKAEIEQWMRDVVVSRIATGFDNWLSVWLYDSLLYGRAHAEIILPLSRREIYAIQELHPRTIDLRPTLDGYSLDIVQIMAMRGMWITLNKRLIVTATNDLAVDMPHGRSLLYGLPFLAEIFTSMHKDQKRIWERFGTPCYHIRYMPPPEMPDPTGTRGTAFIGQMMNLWNTLMLQRANGDIADYGTAGDVEVRVIGAAGEQLKFVEPLREIVSQLIAKTGLPPFMLGMQWQTTETMSAVEGGLLSQMIEQIRQHVEPELYYLIRLRQLLAGKNPEFKIGWTSPTLIDLFEKARAAMFQAKADAQDIANDEDLWRVGVIDNVTFARRHRPDLEDKTDDEIRALLPDLAALPPAPSQPGAGFGAELQPDTSGGAGSGARSLTYDLLTKSGRTNGRH